MTDHLTHEQLLQYLDGELPKAAMRATSIHIQSCWGCRTELERLHEDIGIIHDAQKQVLLPGLPPPPRPWPRLEPLLVAAQAPELMSWRRISLLIDLMRRPVPVLTVLAGLFAACALLWLNPGSVSAKEILRRVSAADAQRLAPPPERYIRQKVKVTKAEHGFGSTHTGEVDSWRSAKGIYWRLADEDAAAADLQRRYEDENVRDLPLSPAAYQLWSTQTQMDGRVSRNADTVDVNFSGVRHPGPGAVQNVSFRLRSADWHVTWMKLDFEDAQFEISEEDLTVLSKSDVPIDVLARLEPFTARPEARVLSARIAEPTIVESPTRLSPSADEVEMDVRFTLHQIGADLGEPIEVASESSSNTTVVRAWGTSPARQELLRQLLEDRPNVRLELQPPTIAVSAGDLQPAQPVTAAPPLGDSALRPDEKRLAKWFGSSASQEQFARYLLATSTDLLARLYALKQLADRWPPNSESNLTEEPRAKLAAMIRDDSRSAAQRCVELRLMAKPLLDEFAPTSKTAVPRVALRDWQDLTRQSLEEAKDADRLLRSLFTTSDTAMALNEALPILQQKLADAEAGVSAVLSSKP
jgi:anti-sigma factor RsiW